MEACVCVTQAKNLDPKDPNGKSDPFYIIGLADEKTELFSDVNACLRSKTIFCTLDPVWDKNHRVHFITTSLSRKVRVELWDKDFTGANEFEGFVVVDVNFFGQDAKSYWEDLKARDSDDTVSGSVHVSITWHYNGGVHPSVKSNKDQRSARIFLSSTFVDMHEERETIMRRVMVELDQYCYDRQVALTYIDMRWGITDEMSKEYKTILSCLQEVNHSRPYFVGIIGQRYGWHQEKDGLDVTLTKTFEHAAAFEEYEWINNYRDRSVTELEILHGFLLHPSVPEGHTFFYFRDPEYLNTLDAATRSKFEDTSPYAKEHLQALKERIQNRAAQWNCTCVVNYKQPTDIGDLLIADLKKALDRDFPILTSASSSAHKQRSEHENYAHQRCHVYVPRPTYFDMLDLALTEKGGEKGAKGKTGRYVLVTGQSGSGKSSLIANWWRSRTHVSKKEGHARGLLADTNTFIHFIGASVVSNSLNSLLSRLYDDINSAKGANEVKIEKPKDEDLIKSFPKFLSAASKRGGMVIIFDAINQLPVKYHDLHWLPRALPPKVQILLSSTPDAKIMDALKERSGGSLCHDAAGGGEGRWLHLAVQPLENDERSKIVSQRLAKYGKKMTPADIDKLIAHPCGSSPLFLTTVLLELCTIGYYAQFQEQLAAFLSCKEMPDLFQRVLARWEESFGVDLAESLLPLLACSRSGVTEKTMQLATQFPPMKLSPMLSAMKQMLVVNHGMYNFGHTYLREAVRKRYSAELQYKASRRLVEVLSKEPFDENTASQLPWQLVKILANPLCKDSPAVQNQLAGILLDLRNFMVFYEHDALKYDLIKYWEKLAELDSKWKLGPKYVESALAAAPKPSSKPQAPSTTIASVKSRRSYTVSTPQSSSSSSSPASPSSAASPSPTAAGIPPKKWEPAHAQSPTAKGPPQHAIFSKGPTTAQPHAVASKGPAPALPPTNASKGPAPAPSAVASKGPTPAQPPAVATKGAPLQSRILVCEETLEVTRTAHTYSVPPATLFALASFLFTVGLDHEARQVAEISLAEFQQVQDNTGIARALYLLGVILRDLGFLADARKNLTEALDLRVKLHGECNAEVATSLDQLGWLLKNTGELVAAIQYFTRALNIQKKLFGNRHEEVASSLNGLGSILCELGDLPKAREYFDEALSIGAELFGNNHPNVAQSLHNLGVMYLKQENWASAHDYCERAYKIRVELFGHNHVDVAASLSILGTVLLQIGKLDLALESFMKAHKIQSEMLGTDHPEVATTLQNLGILYKRMGNLAEARKYHDSALEIRIKLFGEFHPLVESSFHNLGSCCFSQGDLPRALECFEKVLAMQTKRHGGHAHPRVQQSLGILEAIAKRLGKMEEAAAYAAKIQKPN